MVVKVPLYGLGENWKKDLDCKTVVGSSFPPLLIKKYRIAIGNITVPNLHCYESATTS